MTDFFFILHQKKLESSFDLFQFASSLWDLVLSRNRPRATSFICSV